MIRVFKMDGDNRSYFKLQFHTRKSARMFCKNTQYRLQQSIYMHFEDDTVEKYISHDTN